MPECYRIHYEQQGESPELAIYEGHLCLGSTDVFFGINREVREANKAHMNLPVIDVKEWEESAAYVIDKSDHLDALVQYAGLRFARPHRYNSVPHDYIPNFVVRLRTDPTRYLILEIKRFDESEDAKPAAAERWAAAVNADGIYGQWNYRVSKRTMDIPVIVETEPLVVWHLRTTQRARNENFQS